MAQGSWFAFTTYHSSHVYMSLFFSYITLYIHFIPLSHLALDLLIRVLYAVILAQHHLPLPLSAHMLNPHLLCHLGRKLANEAWVPELARNA